ncbi:MAG: hypothetical protein E7299_02670 [Lachnospiraceae bacterium]|nr:hypothetical protein [Lachnospiraceae bacterium]
MEQNYTLTVIEEIETPLAATAGEPTYAFLIIFALLAVCVAVLVVGGVYHMECSRYQKRYAKLHMARTGEVVAKKSWNIIHLKEMVMEEEVESASLLLFDEDFSLSR